MDIHHFLACHQVGELFYIFVFHQIVGGWFRSCKDKDFIGLSQMWLLFYVVVMAVLCFSFLDKGGFHNPIWHLE